MENPKPNNDNKQPSESIFTSDRFLSLEGSFILPIMQENHQVMRFGKGIIEKIIPLNGKFIVIAGGGAAMYEFGFKNPIWEIDLPSTSGTITRDNNKLVLSWANEIYLHEIDDNGLKINKLIGPKNKILSIDISFDGKFLAAGGLDNLVYLWDLESGQAPISYKGHSDVISQVAFSACEDILASSAEDGIIRIWNFSNKDVSYCLYQNEFGFNHIAFSDNGKYLISWGQDATIRVWDPWTHQELKHYNDDPSSAKKTYPIHSVAINSNGNYLAYSAGGLNNISIIKTNIDENILELTGHTNAINVISFNRDKPILYTGSTDNTIRIWDLPSGSETIRFDSDYTGGVNCLAISQERNLLVSGGYDCKIHFWNMSTGEQIDCLNLENKISLGIHGIYFANQNNQIVFNSDREVVFGNWENPSENPFHFYPCDGCIQNLCSSSDQKYYSTLSWNIGSSMMHDISLNDSSNGKQVWRISTEDLILAQAISPDNHYLAFGGKKSSITLVDFINGREIRNLYGHKGTVHALSFSPDCKYIISGSGDGTVRCWEVETGMQISQIGPYRDKFFSLAISPDSAFCALGTNFGQIGIMKMGSDKLIKIINSHSSSVSCLMFTPDNKLLFSGSADGTIRAWDYLESIKRT
ncbi:MAG: hypothetical protein P4L50_23795 [Anaerolineaceae bacterium]|nr:hypothetical protein [Anaerolineaceae bacterium]